MAEGMTNNTKGRPNPNKDGENKSNMIRSMLFTFVVICLMAMMIANMIQGNNNKNAQKTEVPISEVIARANDPDGNIAKISVKGDTLDITLKEQDQATETSRKDGSGTLYDQGLVNHCDGLTGDELKDCEGKYPTIEYQEDVNTWGIVLDVALTVLPIIIIVGFFVWMMRQANAESSATAT